MALSVGLVGLPNVGKSTLFNALTKSSIPAENYPFCTIDPHMAITYVPDERLLSLAKAFGSAKLVPTTVQFVDIAGLVKGAAQGQGLGNQFLSHIMEVDLIVHVLRCFEDGGITHVSGAVNPLEDFEIICTELMLKDLETVTRRQEKLAGLIKKAAGTPQTKVLEQEKVLLASLVAAMQAADIAKVQELAAQGKAEGILAVPLLVGKNFIVAANVSEDEYVGTEYEQNKHYQSLVARFGIARVVPVSAKIEAELAQMAPEEAQGMMQDLGITQRGLDQIILKAHDNLGLITFFTVGPKEAHAWSIKAGTKVPQAGGTIHSDLERGFICAEIYQWNDLLEAGSEAKLKLTGKLRTEGKDYIVQDGDVLHVRFNV